MWSHYQEQLREVDDNLYNLKEQFKLTLATPRTSIEEIKEKVKVEETEEESDNAEE